MGPWYPEADLEFDKLQLAAADNYWDDFKDDGTVPCIDLTPEPSACLSFGCVWVGPGGCQCHLCMNFTHWSSSYFYLFSLKMLQLPKCVPWKYLEDKVNMLATGGEHAPDTGRTYPVHEVNMPQT